MAGLIFFWQGGGICTHFTDVVSANPGLAYQDIAPGLLEGFADRNGSAQLWLYRDRLKDPVCKHD